MALQDIQSEEVTRELQAQQEAAEAQVKAEEAAAAAAAKKSTRKQQRQRKQAKLKAVAQACQQEAYVSSADLCRQAGEHDSGPQASRHEVDAGTADRGTLAGPTAAQAASRHRPEADTANKVGGQQEARPQGLVALVPGRTRTVVPIHNNQADSSRSVSGSRASKRPSGPKAPCAKGSQSASLLAASASAGHIPSKHAAHENELPGQQQPKAVEPGSKPRILEVRRPRRPVQQLE